MNRKFLKLSILIALIIAPLSLAREGVLLGMPDPAIVEGAEGGVYYIFATGKGLPIYRSEDLVEWELVDRVFDTPVPKWAKETIPGTDGIWAPDVVKLNDTFYVYYCCSTFGGQHSVIGVASNKTLDPDSPDYKWVDHGLVVESFPNKTTFNAIDPAVFQDADGSAVFVWGSYWGGIHFTQLDPETGKFLNDPADISIIAARPNHAIEGAYIVKKDGFYYMFVSFDSCCDGAESTYRVMVGRSDNIAGPYVDQAGKPMTEGGATLVLSNNDNWRGPGHNSVLTTDQGSWLVHHTYDTFNLDRQRILQIRPIYWTEGGWPVAGEPLTPENPKTTEKANVRRGDIVGTWRLSLNYMYGPETLIDLLPNGRIANHREARWQITDNRIAIRMPGESPWGGEYLIEPQGGSFIGRNPKGDIVRGIQLER